jgi:hypothetical protein
MTAEAHQFLSIIAPRGYKEATLLAVALKVTVVASFLAAISDGLTVLTTFSILTPCKRWNGRTLLRSSPDSPFFSFVINQTTQHYHQLSWHLLDTLAEISSKVEHGMNSSTFHVLTSQKIIDVAALQQPVRLFEQFPENLSRVSKRG